MSEYEPLPDKIVAATSVNSVPEPGVKPVGPYSISILVAVAQPTDQVRLAEVDEATDAERAPVDKHAGAA